MKLGPIIALALCACACGASSTPAILMSPDPSIPAWAITECGPRPTMCVGNDLRRTGACCPDESACGGGFPNVGCAPDSCCFEPDAELGARRPTAQHRAPTGAP